MISPKDVEPFDEDATKAIAAQEARIDAELKATKGWVGVFSQRSSEQLAEIARRYSAAGWHVRVKGTGDVQGEVIIRHPAWVFPEELVIARTSTLRK